LGLSSLREQEKWSKLFMPRLVLNVRAGHGPNENPKSCRNDDEVVILGTFRKFRSNAR
jgi:hypothetical protein